MPTARRAAIVLALIAAVLPVQAPAALAAEPSGPETERLLAAVTATEADVRQAAAELHAAITQAVATAGDAEAMAAVRRWSEILDDQLWAARIALDEAAVLRPGPALDAADRLVNWIQPSFESAVLTLAEGADGLSAADLRENILARPA